MSDFYYCISGSNNDIVNVLNRWHSWMSDGLGEYIYDPAFSGSFESKSMEDISPLWNEAKRCPLDSGSRARYRYDGSTIQPKSNVQNIDYDSGSMDINDDGTLSWK